MRKTDTRLNTKKRFSLLWNIQPRSNARVALTIGNEMLRYMERNLDGEGARFLRSVDNGDDTRADGNQREGHLIQGTV